MSDLNVTEAAEWDEGFYNDVIARLESGGQTELVEQAKGARERGQAGLDEWRQIEAKAATMSGDELAKVGKGPHLLEESEAPADGEGSEEPTTSEEEVTE